jgi:hypothetical protein
MSGEWIKCIQQPRASPDEARLSYCGRLIDPFEVVFSCPHDACEAVNRKTGAHFRICGVCVSEAGMVIVPYE